MISFYDNSDPNGDNFYSRWGNKYITISGTCNGVTKSFTALIADTCGNSDCDGCCSTNADPTTGYLIDMEYNTAIRHFGSIECADVAHTLSFTFEEEQPLAITNCGTGIGSCTSPQTCCSADNKCGSGADFCEELNGCQSTYGVCAGPKSCGAVNGASCGVGECCSKYGFCGNSTAYCDVGCQSAYGECHLTPPPGICGSTTLYGEVSCTTGNCCSKFGFCGTTETYCEATTCQSKYGVCWDPPTAIPTFAPTSVPTSPSPTEAPSDIPTVVPTTTVPTAAPSFSPTIAPTDKPTPTPTNEPTMAPTVSPTTVPTRAPTAAPSATPSLTPVVEPTVAPTASPSVLLLPDPTIVTVEVTYKIGLSVSDLTAADKAIFEQAVKETTTPAPDSVAVVKVTEGQRRRRLINTLDSHILSVTVRLSYNLANFPSFTEASLISAVKAAIKSAVGTGAFGSRLRSIALASGSNNMLNVIVYSVSTDPGDETVVPESNSNGSSDNKLSVGAISAIAVCLGSAFVFVLVFIIYWFYFHSSPSSAESPADSASAADSPAPSLSPVSSASGSAQSSVESDSPRKRKDIIVAFPSDEQMIL
jgi:hypothetical protein